MLLIPVTALTLDVPTLVHAMRCNAATSVSTQVHVTFAEQ